MDFSVELSHQAQADIAGIYDWLRSQEAGDAGERWFAALRTAIDSLTSLPTRCPLAPENRDSPVHVRQLLYGAARTSTGSCLRSSVTWCRFSTSDMAVADGLGISEQFGAEYQVTGGSQRG